MVIPFIALTHADTCSHCCTNVKWISEEIVIRFWKSEQNFLTITTLVLEKIILWCAPYYDNSLHAESYFIYKTNLVESCA